MDGEFDSGFRKKPLWILVLAALTLSQGLIALERLGGREALADVRPVLAGRHPLHLYHGTLGAETFRQRQATACYDPAFQAGYPKTPVFDSGCRPAELVFVLVGGDPVVAYKYGLFFLCAIVPAVFAVAARGLGVGAGGSCVAAALGSCVWWTKPTQTLFDAGDIDILLSGLCLLVFVSWLSRYHWDAGPASCLLLALTAIVGWYAQPVIWLGLLPVFAAYYIVVAPRHGPAWHLGLAGITFAGLAPNLWWLWDWGRFWWLRQPSVSDVAPFPTWGALLGTTSENFALLGGGPLGAPLVLLAAAACVLLLILKYRSAAFAVASTAALAALVARLGELWPPFHAGGASRAAPLLASLSVLPVAAMCSVWARRATLGGPLMIALCALPLILAGGATPVRNALHFNTSPLLLGLSPDQEQFVDGLISKTNGDARILLEDIPPDSRPGWNWTALLPTLAERTFLGGLDPDACFEHAYCSLIAGRLNGQPLAEWSDAALAEFARRYNVGWVAARSSVAIERWRKCPMAKEIARFRDGGEVVLFELDRPKSFVLVGQAKWEQADRRKIVLTDVVPADAPHPDGGPVPAKVIVLSFHHVQGLKVSPNVVTVERDPDAFDPIPMIRLRMSGPLSRIVISWDNR